MSHAHFCQLLPVLLPGKAALDPELAVRGMQPSTPIRESPLLHTDSFVLQCCERCHDTVLEPLHWQPVTLFPAKAWQRHRQQRGGGKIKKALKWIRYRRGKAYEAMLGFLKFSSACCSWQVSFSCGIREGLSLPAGATAQLFSWSGLQPFADHRYYPTSGCVNNYCTWKLRRFLPRESFVQINTSSVRFCSSLWKLQRLLKLGLPAVYQFSGWRHSREYVRQATHVSCFFGCRRMKL